MQAGGALAGGEQARHRRHLRLGVHPHAAHHVVGRGPDFHRLLGDVHAGELLELVVHPRKLVLDVRLGAGELLADPRDVEEHAAVRAAAPFFRFAHDAARHVVAREQLGRPPRGLVALGVAPPLVFVVRRLVLVEWRDVVEHEPAAVTVAEHAAFAAHRLGHQDPLHAQRPHHAGGVELQELHVDQVGACLVRQRVAVAGVLPAVAGDAIGPAHTTGREDHRAGAEQAEAAALALVGERPGDAVAVLEQADDGALHVKVDAAVHAVILERADHFEAGAIPHVREARVGVPAEVALQDAAVGRTVEQRPPRLQLAHPRRRLLRVQLRHAPVVQILPAAHGVGEVHAPAVAVVHVGERRRDAALGHHRVRLAEQRLAHHAHAPSQRRRLDRRPQPRAAGADHQDVVLVGLVLGRGH